MNLLSYMIILYGLWVVISIGMHYCAINTLELEECLFSLHTKSIRTESRWLIWCLVHYAVIHLFFLSFFLILIVIFRSTENRWNMLTWIPLIFIPCLLVGLYQFYIDTDFLNNRPFHRLDRDPIGGLGTDLTAFRVSLFLIFSLCIFTAAIVQVWWKKILYILIATVIVWLIWLSSGRGIIVATLLFAAIFPIVGAWVHGFRSDKGRRYLYVGLISILLMALLMGAATTIGPGKERSLQTAFDRILNGDFAKVDPFRLEMIQYQWRLVKLAPIAGWGPGGFLRNIDKVRFVSRDHMINEDPFSQYQYHYGLNQYLEWGNDIGLLGGCVILFLYVMPLWMIIRVQKRILMREDRWAVGIIFATLIIMLLLFNVSPYAHFPEGQWIILVYLSFLISVALKYGYTVYPIKGWRWGVGAFLLTTVFIAGVYETTFGSRGYAAIYRESLFHPAGTWKNQADKKTTVAIKSSVNELKALSNIISVKVSSTAQNSLFVNGVKLKILMNDELIDVRHFFKSSNTTLCYYVPSMKGKNVQIKTEIHPVFKVYRDDDALIRVSVSPPSFIETLPEEGIGFYPRAKSLIGRCFNPGSPAEPVIVDARWTGMQATLNVTELMRNKGFLYLQSSNPYQERRPVCVDIVGEQGGMKRVWFWNGHWKKIYLPPDQLKQTKTLTFRVNQTWNPSLVEVSDDSRDLGIVVALPEFDEGRHFLFEHLSPSSGEV